MLPHAATGGVAEHARTLPLHMHTCAERTVASYMRAVLRTLAQCHAQVRAGTQEHQWG